MGRKADRLVEEQIAYYRARAPEYDQMLERERNWMQSPRLSLVAQI